jgi:DNA-binding Lrp family transcriptional regulator
MHDITELSPEDISLLKHVSGGQAICPVEQVTELASALGTSVRDLNRQVASLERRGVLQKVYVVRAPKVAWTISALIMIKVVRAREREFNKYDERPRPNGLRGFRNYIVGEVKEHFGKTGITVQSGLALHGSEFDMGLIVMASDISTLFALVKYLKELPSTVDVQMSHILQD